MIYRCSLARAFCIIIVLLSDIYQLMCVMPVSTQLFAVECQLLGGRVYAVNGFSNQSIWQVFPFCSSSFSLATSLKKQGLLQNRDYFSTAGKLVRDRQKGRRQHKIGEELQSITFTMYSLSNLQFILQRILSRSASRKSHLFSTFKQGKRQEKEQFPAYIQAIRGLTLPQYRLWHHNWTLHEIYDQIRCRQYCPLPIIEVGATFYYHRLPIL